MIRLLLTACLALALTACASVQSPLDDGYQVGDLTGTVIQLQAEYCATADPRERAFRLAALRAAGVPVPPSGACTDILSLIPDGELDIDVEQAERDRERFEAE
ncbi:hypothetical protein ACFQH5_20285 [Halomonas salifodinae]|uniref:Lipoprotein n=1 Tax=Halomonas salifodinae TaxID=438745 RepID=A0ABW2F4R0_9GAMM